MIKVKTTIGKIQKIPNGRLVSPDGTEFFIYNGVYHRDNGPAVYNKRTGYAAYYKRGVLHNSNGPALINPKLNYIEYWKDGLFIKRESYQPEEKGFINGGISEGNSRLPT